MESVSVLEISNSAWLYIFSFGLLMGSLRSFFMKLGPMDNTPTLNGIKYVGLVSSIVLFIWGFFIFKWYVPIIAFLIASFLIQILLNLLIGRSTLLIFILKDHIGMLVGLILSIVALLF